MKKSFLFLRVIFILILLCAFQTFAQTCGTPNNINQNEVDGPIPLGTRWALYQTFTPDCNGIVDNITVWHKSTTAYTANVFLRQGANPVGSDILDNFTFTFPASPSGASQNVIDFSSTANLTAGQTYAFAFVFSNGDDIGFDFRAADPYPDGTLYWIEESTSSWENAIGGAVDLRFRVNWVDQSPYVTCREGRSFALGADGTVDISFSQVSAGSGPSDGESVLIRSINPSSFDCDDIGPQTVSLTVQDTSGQNAFCSTTITITDGEDPKLTCPDDITVNIDPFVPAIITYDAPTVDDCTASTLTQTAGLPSGSVFPVGTTTNTFEAVDAYGNVGTCSFDVTVVENPFEVLVELDNGTLRITDIGDTSDINLTITENVGGNAFFLSDLPPAQISTGINRLTSSLLWVTIADITNGIEFIGGNGNNSITIDSDISINGDFDIKNINTFTQNGAITITGAFKVSESITLDLKIRRALTAQSLDITGIYSLKDQSPGYPITVSGTTNIQTAEDVDLSLGATAPHVFGGLVNINAFNFSLASSQSIELGTIIATDSDNIRRNEIYVGSGNLTLTADIVTAGDSDLYLRAEESINQSSGIVVTDHLFFDGSNDEDTIALFFGNNDIDMIEVETGRTMELIVFNDIDDMEIGLLNIGDASLFAPTMNLTENTNIFKNGTGSLTIGSDTSTINITNSTTNTVANIEHNAGLVEFFGSTITVEKLDYQGASGTRTRFLDGNTTFNDLDLSLEFGTLAIQAPVNIGSSGINIEVLDELLIDKFNGVLSGTGTFTGISTTVELDGTIAPGNGTTPSTLTIQSVEFDEGTFAPYIDTDSAFDQLNVVGTVTLTDADFAPTGDFSIDDANIGVITLINNDGVDAVVGTFNGLAEGAQVTLPGTSEDFTISYVGGDGNDVILIRESTFAPVIICPPDITLECGTAIGLGVSSDTPIDIPDNDDTGITSIANVSGLDASFQVIDITVQTAMNHTWIGDLAMEVTAPGGESVVLFAESLAESSDLNATFPITFTDSATVPANDIGETIDNIEAVCQVDNICEYTAMGGTDAFAQLISEINANGSPINGDWTLSIRDQVFQDTGTLVSWQVKIVALNPNPDPTDPAATGTATATDTQGTPTITYSDVVVSGDCGNTGTTERTWTATDADANVSTCVQTITVTDTTAPVVTSCPEDIVFEIAEGETEAIITYDLPEATDLCGDATITQTEGLAS
ncbi:MAG: HYR domain-containing protein, partial [Bacteroidota bacterium]